MFISQNIAVFLFMETGEHFETPKHLASLLLRQQFPVLQLRDTSTRMDVGALPLKWNVLFQKETDSKRFDISEFSTVTHFIH